MISFFNKYNSIRILATVISWYSVKNDFISKYIKFSEITFNYFFLSNFSTLHVVFIFSLILLLVNFIKMLFISCALLIFF